MACVRSAGVVSAVAAVAVYAVMWLGHQQGWGWLDTADSSSLSVLHDVGVKHPLWVRFWEDLCAVFSPLAFRLLGAVTVVIALVKRRPRVALFLFVSIEFSELVSWAAKGLVGRPRPVTALVAEPSSSFPSGHAVASIVGVLALLTVLLPLMNRPTAALAAAVGALVVLAVGFGRVALNVHHPSDVVAGWALGYLYFALCLALSGVGSQDRRRRADGRGQGSAGSLPACPPRA